MDQMQKNQESNSLQQLKQEALADLCCKTEAAIRMLSSNSVLGVNQLHRNADARLTMLAPVLIDEIHQEHSNAPEALGRAFLANVHKELLALLPLEALQRLQTALQTEQFFVLADPSPDDIHRFPEGRECIQARLAKPPCTGRVVHLWGQSK